MKQILYLIALIPALLFAQAEPVQNTEIQLLAKQKALQAECAQISKAVPCAVGIGDVDKLPAAMSRSERDARYKLALSVKAFVNYAASDSSWIEDGVAQELSKISGKISIDTIALVNSTVLNFEYGIITDEISGKKFYRVVTLMVVNPQLYNEAQKEIEQPGSSSSSSEIVQPSPQPAAKPAAPKIDFKNIATKTAKFLLGIARKVIGL